MEITYDSWQSESAKCYVYSNLPLEKNAEIFFSKDTGDIQTTVYKLGDLVIKQRKVNEFGEKVCKECINREYNIGVILNKLESPHLMKTIGYFETIDDSFIVSSYIEGEDFEIFSSKYNFDTGENNLVCYHICLIIQELQEKINFVHYDLHEGNVIIRRETPIRYDYYFKGKYVSLISPFRIKLIDFARSHVDGIEEGYYDGIISSTITPGIFDPLIDLAFLSRWNFDITFDVETKPRFASLLKDNKLLDDKGFTVILYPKFIFDSLYGNYKVWASQNPSDLYIDDVVCLFMDYLLRLGEENRLTIEDIDKKGILKNMVDQNTINFVTADLISEKIEIPEETLDYYRKRIGNAIVNEKLIAISKRDFMGLDPFEMYMNSTLCKIDENGTDEYKSWVNL